LFVLNAFPRHCGWIALIAQRDALYLSEGGRVIPVITITVIVVMVALTVAVAAYYLAPRMGGGRVLFAVDADAPAAFGYDMGWLAVRTRDTQAVVQALGLERPQPCNWNSGIGVVYDAELGANHIFVSPPVNGWTFVVGLALPHPSTAAFVDKCTPLLVALGGRFVEVQSYFCYPPIDMFAWARMVDGRLLRSFAAGDEGVIWNKGKTTREERALGLKLFELRGVRGRRGDAGGELILHPTEDHVMRLALRWSLDPTRLNERSAAAGVGVIGLAPAAWRPERARPAARPVKQLPPPRAGHGPAQRKHRAG
jgi:hypothetical protein